MKKYLLSVLVLSSFLGLTSCQEADEVDDLAKAQKCLNEVPQSHPESAEACFMYVAKYESQRANILKCSIYMTAGGLIESKIVKAYEVLKNKNNAISEANRTAAYMSILALDRPHIAGGYTKAVAADPFCQRTGVPGIKYISGVILAGSWMAKTMEALAGAPINFEDPAAIEAAVNQLLDQTTGCNSPNPPQECIDDLATLGTTVATLSVSYCSNEKADAKVCDDINKAKEQAGSNATDIGQALLCLLKKKNFDPNTQTCT